VGVRGRLEIGQKPFWASRTAKAANRLVNLRSNRKALQPSARAEASDVAEDAPAGTGRAIHVGAGEPGINTNFGHAAAELAPKEPTETMITQAGVTPVHRWNLQAWALIDANQKPV
jgi:hypothetical protein